MADPVRDLNNYLQGQPGNLTREFKWTSMKEGPVHGTIYHVTAVCEHSLRDVPSVFFWFLIICKIVRDVNIGVGHGSSMSAAKREASMQALDYLRSHGKYDPRTRILGSGTNRKFQFRAEIFDWGTFWWHGNRLGIVDKDRLIPDPSSPIRMDRSRWVIEWYTVQIRAH
jgi:hypothetical protein